MKATTTEVHDLLDRIRVAEHTDITDLLHIGITGPSGGGKTTLMRNLCKGSGTHSSIISATTRKPREGEMPGEDYFFLTRNEFEATKMLEHNEYNANHKYYGTLYSQVEHVCVDEGKRFICDMDPNGGVSLKRIFTDTFLFVFLERDLSDLKGFLTARMGRTGESMEDVELRLHTAELELNKVKEGEIIPDFILKYPKEMTPEVATKIIWRAAHKCKSTALH